VTFNTNLPGVGQPGQSSQCSDWLQTGRQRGRSRVPVTQDFPPLHIVQTGSGAHAASYPMGIGSFSGVKRQGREADHSPPPSAEVKNTWISTSAPPHIFIA
jgi:hypothetical protein